MGAWCDSCGGILGRECFNPQECALIRQQMDQEAQAQEQAYWAGVERAYYAEMEQARTAAAPVSAEVGDPEGYGTEGTPAPQEFREAQTSSPSPPQGEAK